MKKYNHGVTIVEILLSILIIGLVLIILFNMLINVRNEDQNNQIQSQYVLNQAQFVEKIEEDIINYGVSSVSACNLYSIDMEGYNLNDNFRYDFKCIRIDYSGGYVRSDNSQDSYLKDNIGYLMVYNYNFRYDVNNRNLTGKENAWMIRYIRGHYENGEWKTLNSLMNEIPSDVQLQPAYMNFHRSNTSAYVDAFSLVVPIISNLGEHYDINLSFTLPSTAPFTCYTGVGSSAEYAKLTCNCTGACSNSVKNGMK